MIIDVKLDDKSKQFIQKAKNEYTLWCDSLSIDYILYEGLTKEACKKFKVSPDCIMQLGFQVMYCDKIIYNIIIILTKILRIHNLTRLQIFAVNMPV